MLQSYSDFYIIIASAIFFFCLFQGYFSITSIKKSINYIHNFKYKYLIKYIIVILFIVVVLYFSVGEVYADEGPGNTNVPPKAEVTIKDNQNTLKIKDSVINIPERVAQGFTNLGTGAAVAAGMKAGASVAKTSGGSPFARVNIIAATGAIGGFISVGANTVNSISGKKNFSSSKSNPGDDGSSAFSIEPGADLDTVTTFLYCNLGLNICIFYLLWAILFIYISDKIVNKKWDLVFIKNIFGERMYSFVIWWFSFASKSNQIWLIYAFILLTIASLGSIYFSYFLLNNIDVISEIVQQSK